MKLAQNLNPARLNKAATVLKAVGHPTRLKILCLLGVYKKMSVTELSVKTDCEQSLISHHLTQLKAKRILEIKRKGKNVFYSLADRQLLNIVKCINNCKNI